MVRSFLSYILIPHSEQAGAWQMGADDVHALADAVVVPLVRLVEEPIGIDKLRDPPGVPDGRLQRLARRRAWRGRLPGGDGRGSHPERRGPPGLRLHRDHAHRNVGEGTRKVDDLERVEAADRLHGHAELPPLHPRDCLDVLLPQPERIRDSWDVAPCGWIPPVCGARVKNIPWIGIGDAVDRGRRAEEGVLADERRKP